MFCGENLRITAVMGNCLILEVGNVVLILCDCDGAPVFAKCA